METKELAKQLGISHQMVNRYKVRGMPVSSLEEAISWRKANIDPFRSKQGRIGGNSGKPYSSTQDVIEATLEKTVPELYFQRVDWLVFAFNEARINATAEQIMEAQDFLYSIYLEEIAYKLSKSKTCYPLPPLFTMMRVSKERKEVIASIFEMLAKLIDKAEIH